MSFLTVNGIQMYVETEGDGPPLLLVHGACMDHSQWRQERLRLNRFCRTIAYDCRGHGQSDKPESYTLADHIQDAISLLDVLGLPSVHLYGVSMGSYIAQGVAIAQPDRIEKLILTVPKSNGLTASNQRLIQNHWAELQGLSEAEIMKVLVRYIAYQPAVREILPELLQHRLTPSQVAAVNAALANFDYRSGLPTVRAKTLVISGTHDELNPPEEGKLCASLIPGAVFVEMKHSGHLPGLEEPELYHDLIQQFLLASDETPFAPPAESQLS